VKINSCREGFIFENYVITQRINGSKIGILMITIKGKEKRLSLLVVCGTCSNEPRSYSVFLNLVDSIGPKRIKETFVR